MVATVQAVDAAAGLALVSGAWRYEDSVRSDPLQCWFDEAVAVESPGPAALQLQWSASQGRYAVAGRALARGEELMVAPAVATVPIDGDSWSAAAVSRIGGADAVGLDAAVLALARALCEAGAAHSLRSLISHRERLDAASLGVWREAAGALASALRDAPSSSSSSAAAAATTTTGGEEEAAAQEEEALVDLLLRVKANAHRVLDDQTASAAVGLGIFPAACLLNHRHEPRSPPRSRPVQPGRA